MRPLVVLNTPTAESNHRSKALIHRASVLFQWCRRAPPTGQATISHACSHPRAGWCSIRRMSRTRTTRPVKRGTGCSMSPHSLNVRIWINEAPRQTSRSRINPHSVGRGSVCDLFCCFVRDKPSLRLATHSSATPNPSTSRVLGSRHSRDWVACSRRARFCYAFYAPAILWTNGRSRHGGIHFSHWRRVPRSASSAPALTRPRCSRFMDT